jgi:hypothetical protein
MKTIKLKEFADISLFDWKFNLFDLELGQLVYRLKWSIARVVQVANMMLILY